MIYVLIFLIGLVIGSAMLCRIARMDDGVDLICEITDIVKDISLAMIYVVERIVEVVARLIRTRNVTN